MNKNTMKFSPSKTAIDRVEPCSETLTGRGGLALFARYLESIELGGPIAQLFGALKKSAKGLSV